MPRITDYKTLVAKDSTKLDHLVRGNINKGWQPCGSPFVFNEYLHQPMVKRSKRTTWVVKRTAEQLADLLDVSTKAVEKALANDQGLRGIPLNEWNRKKIDGQTEISIPKDQFDRIVLDRIVKVYGEKRNPNR